jgi:hypothetical protein
VKLCAPVKMEMPAMKLCSKCNTTNDNGRELCYSCRRVFAPSESVTKTPSEAAANKVELPFMLKLWQPVKQIFHVLIENIIEKTTFKDIYNSIRRLMKWILAGVFVVTGFVVYHFGRPVLSEWLKVNQKPTIVEVQCDKRPVPPGAKVILTAVVRDDDQDLEFKWKSQQATITSLLGPKDQKAFGNYKVEVEVPRTDILAEKRIEVSLTVGDGNDESKEEITQIDVWPKRFFNHPPTLTPIQSNRTVIRAGERAELSATSFDKDGDPIELTWECMCPLGAIIVNGEKKEKVVFEVPMLKPFPLGQFQVEIKLKADDKNGGTAGQEIALLVLPPGSEKPLGIPRKPSVSLSLNNVERINMTEQKWLLKADAMGEGLTYRWTYKGDEVGKDSILIFDSARIKNSAEQGSAAITVTVEDKYRSKISQIIRVPIDKSSN